MQSDTMQRLQAVARSQIAAAIAGAAWALSRLPEGQRQLLADDVVRDLEHVKAICKDITQAQRTKGDREEIARALDNLGHIAERLTAYYEKYISLLGASAQRQAISAMSTEERGALRRLVKEVGDEETAKPIASCAQKTSMAIDDLIKLLRGQGATGQATKKAISVDEMTYALGKLAALAESVNQTLRSISAHLQKQPRTMPQKATASVKNSVKRWFLRRTEE
jgi:hypothetical protein